MIKKSTQAPGGGLVLRMTIKRKWFDMILSGEKKEEYREPTQYWLDRILDEDGMPKKFAALLLVNGYDKNAPWLKVECKKIRYGGGKVKWGSHPDDEVLVFKLGKILAKSL